jgi:hypothetical protein
MNEPLNRLEAELAAMRPRGLPAELVQRIEANIAAADAQQSPWPDRFLLSAIGSGVIAACVIVGVLLKPANEPVPQRAPAVMAATSDPPRAGDFSLAIARAEIGPS